VAETLVGIRLALRGQRDVTKGLKDVADGERRVGTEARGVGRHAITASRGLAAMADRKITAGIRGVSSVAGGLAGMLKGPLVGGAKATGVAVAGAAVGLGILGVKSVQAASDASETGSAFGTVYGDAATAAQSWIDAQSKAFGLNGAQLQNAMVGYGGLGKQAGLTGNDLAKFGSDLTGAALDLGSFWNKSTEDTLAALQSGLTGEAEPLKAYGIFMSDAALNAFAMSKGIRKTTQDMTEQEKVALRQQFILANLGDAQGDLAKTSGGLSNQQRALSGRWLTMKQLLGKGLTPAALGLTTALNTGLGQAIDWITPRIDGLSAAAQRVGDRFVAAGAQVPNLFGAIKDGDTQGIAEVLDNMAGNSGAAVGPISTALDTIVTKGTELVAVGRSVKGAWDEMPISPLQLLSGALSFAANNVGLVSGALMVILPLWGAYRTAVVVSNIATSIATGVTGAYTIASSFLAGAKGRETAAIAGSTVASRAYAVGSGIATAAQWLWNAAMSANPIVLVAIAVAGLVAGIVIAYQKVGWFRTAVDAVWGALKTAGEWLWNVVAPFTPLGAAIHLVVNHFDDLKKAIGWAWDKLQGFWDLVKKAGSFLGKVFGFGGDDSSKGKGIGGAAVNLPGRAMGGNVKVNQPYIVGERRPELFVPKVSGTILPRVPTPRDDTDGVPAGVTARGGDLHIHMEVDGREIGSTVIKDFRRRQARR
jgi:hypothetical protein